MILFSALIIAIIPTEAEAKIYDDTVRLHILANSDSEEDQQLKLELRDAILCEFGEDLRGFDGAKEASDALLRRLDDIETFSNEFLKDRGYNYNAEATLSEEWYDTRNYEGFSLPKGYYTSLRIIIGDGAGQNWWCVMYPPLCLDFATSDGYTDEEEALVLGKYKVKFKILELISELTR